MHPDLEQLIVADAQDTKIKGLRKKKLNMEQTLARAIERESETAKIVEDLGLRIVANRERQHELQRSTSSYEARLRSANNVLEHGGGDAEAAERQVLSVTEKLDALETELLERMEELEELENSLVEALENKKKAEEFLSVERATQPPALQKLHNAYNAIIPVRTEALAGVDSQISSRYENLLSRKGRAIAEIYKGSCSACQMVVRQQHIADLDRGLVQTCGGCGRWLVLTPNVG